MSEWCQVCERKAPVDGDGYFRLHSDHFDQWCLNSGQPSPSLVELEDRRSLRRAFQRAARGGAHVAGRVNERREARRYFA